MVIYIQGLYKGTEREMLAIIVVHLYNSENHSYKKKDLLFSCVFRLKGDDIMMDLQRWILFSF